LLFGLVIISVDKEALMMIGSVFRIVQIQHDENQSYIIRLILHTENDQDMKNTFEHLKKEYNAKEKNGWVFSHSVTYVKLATASSNFSSDPLRNMFQSTYSCSN
jgi:hypothetical protein